MLDLRMEPADNWRDRAVKMFFRLGMYVDDALCRSAKPWLTGTGASKRA